MRPLRPATREIVERLQPDGAGLWSRVGLRCDGITLIIDEIGLSGRQAAIIHLLPHLLGEPPAAHAAAQAVATILRWKGVRALAQLEKLRHRLRKWNPDSRWQDLSLKDIPRLGRLPHGWVALGLASWHPNGYIREAAVQALARRTEAGKHELPFLLLRCND